MARRVSWLSHSQEVTSHGWCMRVSWVAALRSHSTFAFGCSCKAEAGQAASVDPSIASCRGDALCSPHATRITSFARRMVPTPIVMALTGTCSMVPKVFFASSREMLSNITRRVWLEGADPGSFRPIFPQRPIPSNCRSTPPNSCIFRSMRPIIGMISRWSIVPSKANTFSALMSTWSINCSFSCAKQPCAAFCKG